MRAMVHSRPGRSILMAAMALALFTASWLTAQGQEGKPAPETAIFKDWDGTWDATIKSQAGESKGVGTYKVGLNGMWLLEHFKGDFGGATFEGHGGTSYDPAKQKYVNVWIDSMSPTPMVSEGTYDKSKKTLTMVGNMATPDGKSMKVTMTTVTKDADTRTFTLAGAGPDGKQMEMLQITYKRRAK
jgi:hypothetical protein